MVRNHISSKNRQTNTTQHGKLRTDRCPWFYRLALPAQLHLHLQHHYRRILPAHRDSDASSSLESASESGIGKDSIKTHFPKDRNCNICMRTKITRAPCRRRKGEAVPRADNFGDLITADHKVLSDNCESRNNHRYAVVVQDLATHWIQSYPCKKQKLHKKPREACKSSWSRQGKPKVIYTQQFIGNLKNHVKSKVPAKQRGSWPKVC